MRRGHSQEARVWGCLDAFGIDAMVPVHLFMEGVKLFSAAASRVLLCAIQ